jgi:hypothetical protein
MSWRKASVSAWVVVALRASSVFPKCVLGYDKHWRGVCCQIDTPDVHAGGMAGQGGLGSPQAVLNWPGTTPGAVAANWGALGLPAAPDTTCSDR